MKRSGFKKLSYAEALQKQHKQQTKRAGKPKSAAAQAGIKRTKKRSWSDKNKEEKWKLAVRTRDDYTCQYPWCRVKDQHIHCHHVAPRSQRKDLIYVVDNGACLCAVHHELVHRRPLDAIGTGLLSNRSKELAEKEGTIGVR